MKKTILKPFNFSTIRPLNWLGFTLAEVLITLGIIGIVAALTIPILMQNIQNAQFKTAWKKQYSTLSQVAQKYLSDNSLTSFKGVANYANTFKDYLHVVQYCDTHSSTQGCWVPSGQDYYLRTLGDGSTIAGVPSNEGGNKDLGNWEGLILNDGTTLTMFSGWNPACSYLGVVCGYILVDVNGFQKPNTLGKDVFGLWVLQDKVSPFGSNAVNRYTGECGDTDPIYGYMGYGCSATYLYGN